MFDLLLIALTVVAFQLCERWPALRGPFTVTALLFWTGYIVLRVRRQHGLLREWGFTSAHLREASLATAAVSIPVAAGIVVWGHLHDRLHVPGHFWVLMALYPVWGLIQQFLLNAMVARNLRRWMPPTPTVLVSSILFGLVHWPDPALMGLTAVAALAWVAIYLRWPNLWPLAVAHGVLGGLAYYFLLARDPWLMVTAVLR